MKSGLDGIRAIPLTPDRAADWERFFSEDAFADHPDWASCWCRCFRLPGTIADWDAACDADANRVPMTSDVRAGTVHGVLAYDGTRVIGWCHADARSAFHFRAPGQAEASPDAPGAAAIVCFLVAPAWRRRGLTRLLLDAACAELARCGFAQVDAYPRKAPEEAAEMFGGPLPVLREAGFSEVAELADRFVLRKMLRS